MRRLKRLITLILTMALLTTGMSISVFADQTTELDSMKVYAVDGSGKKTEVDMDFDSSTYSYDITVMSDTVSIKIEASTSDSQSKWFVEKDGINTKMDFGKNYTAVLVTSASGATNKYEINTTKLTEEEEATYKADDEEETTKETETKTETTKNNSSSDKVVIGEGGYKIVEKFKDDIIPEGFVRTTAKYDGKQYQAIKGERKDLTAFYLKSDDGKGFYIYDSDKETFTALTNIKIASRMYTVVTPEKKASFLKNYKKKDVTVIDQEVKVWILDEEEGLYLLYAMNWNGDTNLYCYDDNEKCFQRYSEDQDVNAQISTANKAYNNVKTKYNDLVSKYNMLLKIACGLVIVIIILIFVIINIKLNKKAKKIKNKKEDFEDEQLQEITDEENFDEISDDVDAIMADIADDVVKELEPAEEAKENIKPAKKEKSKKKKSYYGDVDDDILIDLVDDSEKHKKEENTESATNEAEPSEETSHDNTDEEKAESEKETDGNLGDDSVVEENVIAEEDDDEDFEFIDLD